MKENILIAFILITLPCSSSAQFKPPTGSGVPFAKKQLQVISLYNNFNCVKNKDKDLVLTSKTFDPLKNLNLYSNPDVVENYFTNLEEGDYESRLGIFYFTDDQLAELLQFFDIIWYINDWELLFNTTAYAVTRMNTQMFSWAISGLLASKPEFLSLKTPINCEAFPQSHTAKWIVRRANGDTAPYPKPADPNNPENLLIYWRYDLFLAQFHQNWHADFPFWWPKDKYVVKGRKGELFLYFHHAIMTRYRAERLSHNMSSVVPLALNKPLTVGDIPRTLNVDLSELPSRKPDLFLQNVPGVSVADMRSWQQRLRRGIDQGYFLNTQGEEVSLRTDAGNDVLGAAIEACIPLSVDYDYYGDLHQDAHLLVAEISDPNGTLGLPPGIQAHLEQSPQDPAFYAIHSYIDNFDKKQQFRLPRYTDDYEFPGVTLNSFKIGNVTAVGGVPILKTFFEHFTYDITNSILVCKDINNEIRRSSKDSAVTVPDRLGIHELIKEVRKSVAETGGLNPYPYRTTRLCGWPQNLLLPRGTKEGLRFKMFVILTSASTGDYDESQFPSLPLCGNPTGRFPDGVPMGFPFNRRIAWSALNVGTNYKSMDLLIRHEEEKN